jgi:hypothetical protein
MNVARTTRWLGASVALVGISACSLFVNLDPGPSGAGNDAAVDSTTTTATTYDFNGAFPFGLSAPPASKNSTYDGAHFAADPDFTSGPSSLRVTASAAESNSYLDALVSLKNFEFGNRIRLEARIKIKDGAHTKMTVLALAEQVRCGADCKRALYLTITGDSAGLELHHDESNDKQPHIDSTTGKFSSYDWNTFVVDYDVAGRSVQLTINGVAVAQQSTVGYIDDFRSAPLFVGHYFATQSATVATLFDDVKVTTY